MATLNVGTIQAILSVRDQATATLRAATQQLRQVGAAAKQFGLPFDEATRSMNVAASAAKQLSLPLGGLTSNLKQASVSATSLAPSMNAASAATKTLGQSARVSSADVQKLGSDMQKLGSSLQSAGAAMLPISAAVGLVGGAVVKLGSDFETGLTKVQTLSDSAAEEVKAMGKEVLDLAPKVGKGPNELVEALLKITSVGIKGKDALALLTASAKGSAVGLGETINVAAGLTAAINAYGRSNLSAARAAEILFKTVVFGGAEADEVADTLGRVAQIAHQAGVSLEEVGTFIATFTSLGVKADEAVTALRGTLNAILNPSAEAVRELENLGLSVDGLRKAVKEKGLTQALIELVQATKGQDDALPSIIGNVRSFAGVLAVAGAQAERATFISKQLHAETDSMGDAFETTSATIKFQANQALANLQVIAVKAFDGLRSSIEGLLALSQPLTVFLRQVVTGFNELPTPAKDVSVIFTALTVALPTLFIGFGSLIRVIGFATKGFEALRAAAQGAAAAETAAAAAKGAIVLTEGTKAAATAAAAAATEYGSLGVVLGVGGPIVLGIGALAAAFILLERNIGRAREEAERIQKPLERIGETAPRITPKEARAVEAQQPLLTAGQKLTAFSEAFTSVGDIGTSQQEIVDFVKVLKDARDTMNSFTPKVRANIAAGLELGNSVEQVAVGVHKSIGSVELYKKTLDAARQAANQAGQAERARIKSLDELETAIQAAFLQGDSFNVIIDEFGDKAIEAARAAQLAGQSVDALGGVGQVASGRLMELGRELERLPTTIPDFGGFDQELANIKAFGDALDVQDRRIAASFERTATAGQHLAEVVLAHDQAIGASHDKIVADIEAVEKARLRAGIAIENERFRVQVLGMDKTIPLYKELEKAHNDAVDGMNDAWQRGVDLRYAAELTLGEKIIRNLKEVGARIADTLVRAFTGGGGLVGAFKALAVQLADAFVEEFVKELLKRLAATKIAQKIADILFPKQSPGGGGGGGNPLTNLANSLIPIILGQQPGGPGAPRRPPGLPPIRNINPAILGPLIGFGTGFGIGKVTGSRLGGALAGAGAGALAGFLTGGPIGALVGLGAGIIGGIVGGKSAGQRANLARDQFLAQFAAFDPAKNPDAEKTKQEIAAANAAFQRQILGLDPASKQYAEAKKKHDEALAQINKAAEHRNPPGFYGLDALLTKYKKHDLFTQLISARNPGTVKDAENAIAAFMRTLGRTVKTFQFGGFISPGQTVPAILHGGRFGERVVPGGPAPRGAEKPQTTIHWTMNVHVSTIDASGFDAHWKARIVPKMKMELLTNQNGLVTSLNRVVR